MLCVHLTSRCWVPELALVRSIRIYVFSMRLSAVQRFLFRLSFGVLAIALGVGVIFWICYNELVHRFPQYTGMHWWEPFGIARTMIGSVGIGFVLYDILLAMADPMPNQAHQLTA